MQSQGNNDPEIPATIGRYPILKRLGRGGMATVYLGYDPGLQREVAIKVIRQHMADDPHYITRFQREIAAIKGLEHSAIVPIYDATPLGEESGTQARPYLVMQYLRGGSLAEKLRSGPLPEIEIVHIVERMASALDAAHKKEIVHRDLKPANILFNEHDEAYLTDFGIVKIMEGDGRSQTQGPIGTPAYMSPEQMIGVAVDGRTDIYALGVILFEMLTGQAAEILFMARLNGHIPSVGLYNSAIQEPTAYDEIIGKALAESPNGRYQRTSDMARLVAAASHSWSAYYQAALELELSPSQTGGSTGKTWPNRPTDTAESVPPLATAESVLPPTTQPGSSRRNRQIVGVLMGLLLLVAATFLLRGAIFPSLTPTPEVAAVPPSKPAPTATIPSSRTPSPTIELPASPAPQLIMVLDNAASAIWQIDEEISRIPANGRLAVPSDQAVLIQSSSEPIEMVLPDRTNLLLDLNTIVEISLPTATTGAIRISLVQGRLLAKAVDIPLTIGTDQASITQPSDSSVGLFVDPATSFLAIDCLSGSCTVQPMDAETVTELETGQSALVDGNGRVHPTPSAQYDLYRTLAEAISSVITPTPTSTATATFDPTPTITPTHTATVNPTALALNFVEDRLQIGQSVNGVPIEVVRLSQGNRPILFVGGIQGGYAPNALALVDEIITHYQTHPEEIPADIALYVIPNLNPDSLSAPGEIDGRFNANHVDLNRNWDCRWQVNNEILNQFVPNSGGTAPVSEPESQALHSFIQTIDPQAVIFWGSGGRGTGLSSPGACEDVSLVSAPLSQAYGRAADHNFVDGPVVETDPTLNGDVSNWLDKIGIPAIFIILPGFEDYQFAQEQTGIQAAFDLVMNGGLTINATPGATPILISPTPVTCTIPPATRWTEIHSANQTRLGCAINSAATPTAAYQLYANGLMVWRQDKEQVYVLYQDGSLTIHTVNDPAFAGYYESDLLKGAFGYLWQDNTAVQNRLGQPQAPEQVAANFTIQDFANGSLFYFADNGSHNYVAIFPESAWFSP